MLRRIVSGGQTGVDRAALDAAMAFGLDCGGWCPRGRRAEDGIIPERYPVVPLTRRSYAARTKRNVEDSDGTLVLTRGAATGGTKLTVAHAGARRRPCLVVDLVAMHDPGATLRAASNWIETNRIAVLNVAGPRESTAPGIGAEARRFVEALLKAVFSTR